MLLAEYKYLSQLNIAVVYLLLCKRTPVLPCRIAELNVFNYFSVTLVLLAEYKYSSQLNIAVVYLLLFSEHPTVSHS